MQYRYNNQGLFTNSTLATLLLDHDLIWKFCVVWTCMWQKITLSFMWYFSKILHTHRLCKINHSKSANTLFVPSCCELCTTTYLQTVHKFEEQCFPNTSKDDKSAILTYLEPHSGNYCSFIRTWHHMEIWPQLELVYLILHLRCAIA